MGFQLYHSRADLLWPVGPFNGSFPVSFITSPPVDSSLNFCAFFRPVSKFIVPDWGDIVDSGIGLSYGSPGYIGRQGRYRTTLCRSQLYPPFRDYEFGYFRFNHWVYIQQWVGCFTNKSLQ
jgi:hypothetical protein